MKPRTGAPQWCWGCCQKTSSPWGGGLVLEGGKVRRRARIYKRNLYDSLDRCVGRHLVHQCKIGNPRDETQEC